MRWAKYHIYSTEFIKFMPLNVFKFLPLLLAFQGQLTLPMSSMELSLAWNCSCLLSTEYSI